VSENIATHLIVFGRGLDRAGSGFVLSESSRARVEAAISYIADRSDRFLARRGTVVFSGGWPGAAEGLPPPPGEFREGALMLQLARERLPSVHKYASLYAETESDSTLENCLRVKEAGIFRGVEFTPDNPLGLVAHQGHMDRAEYFTRRVFRLQRRCVRRIFAAGQDRLSGDRPEETMLRLTRIACFGAHSASGLRARHRLLSGTAERLRRG
jgi:DUF218 domain